MPVRFFGLGLQQLLTTILGYAQFPSFQLMLPHNRNNSRTLATHKKSHEFNVYVRCAWAPLTVMSSGAQVSSLTTDCGMGYISKHEDREHYTAEASR